MHLMRSWRSLSGLRGTPLNCVETNTLLLMRTAWRIKCVLEERQKICLSILLRHLYFFINKRVMFLCTNKYFMIWMHDSALATSDAGKTTPDFASRPTLMQREWKWKKNFQFSIIMKLHYRNVSFHLHSNYTWN